MMSDLATVTRDCDRLLATLDDAVCHYCDGDLETGAYKGSSAILCQDCGTPAVRVW